MRNSFTLVSKCSIVQPPPLRTAKRSIQTAASHTAWALFGTRKPSAKQITPMLYLWHVVKWAKKSLEVGGLCLAGPEKNMVTFAI